MTIYIHFVGTARPAERLHNILSVEDDGVRAIKVKPLFTDDIARFENVSHVALQPSQE